MSQEEGVNLFLLPRLGKPMTRETINTKAKSFLLANLPVIGVGCVGGQCVLSPRKTTWWDGGAAGLPEQDHDGDGGRGGGGGAEGDAGIITYGMLTSIKYSFSYRADTCPTVGEALRCDVNHSAE